MKHLAALSLAAFVTMGAVSGAQAFVPGMIAGEQVGLPYVVESEAGPVPHDPCHGRMSGTAHASCGSLTGGPSGGLF